MDTLSYKTISANKENANKEWLLVDAENETLGRLASKVAKMIRGKHKTNFTPHADCGDNVIVINAEKVRLSGNKWDEKVADKNFAMNVDMDKPREERVKEFKKPAVFANSMSHMSHR